jgi:large subunit ribosomal protein L24e
MVKCSFCSCEIPEGTGMMYVKKDGKISYYCSKKCEKSVFKFNRKARTTKWTQEFVKGQ